MVTRCRHVVLLALVSMTLVTVACEKVPLLAPSGSTITLSTSTNVLAATASTTLIAQVLEQSGTPPHSGTHVNFTTTLGRIEPAEALTDLNGRVTVTFSGGGGNGTATISAVSGAATTGTNGIVKIAVGTAAVGSVHVNANPASVSALGGSTTISAAVLDINGNALSLAPVVFSTTAGTLSSSVVTTDGSGSAVTVLTTSQQAVVTASVGVQSTTTTSGSSGGGSSGGSAGGTTAPTTTTTSGQASGTVTVTVNAAPTLVITPPATASAGLPASFTFVVGAAASSGTGSSGGGSSGSSAVRDLTVRWGDGGSQSLGAVTGNAVVSHTYQSTGSYAVSATLLDSSGNSTTVATTVNVLPVATATIIITPSVPSSCTGSGTCTVSFQIQVTPPTGVGIVGATVSFGTQAIPAEAGLGGLSGSATVQAQYPAHAGAQTVSVTVTDTLNRTTAGFTTISIP